ncbi:MAG: efflux RND transporter periplasmic adaptor subunit [Chitinophagaceae bacterium]
MKKSSIWIITCAVLLIALLAILKATGHLGESAGVKVTVEQVSHQNIIESVNASGKIYPLTEVKISPDVSGEITELYVEEGDSVRKGQVLAAINSTTYKSMVNRASAQLNQSKSSVSNATAIKQQAQAQLDQANATFKRNKQLFDEKVISAVEFETALGNYKSAQANYKAAMESIKGNQYGVQSAQANVNEAVQNLRKTTLYAPMGGIISKLFVKKGERVVGTAQMAGTEIMRVADMSKMKVDVEVGENDIQKVKYDDTAYIEVDAYPNRKFKGLVVKIAQSSVANGIQQSVATNDQVANYTVSIEILNDSYADLWNDDRRNFPFRPGMSANVEIFTKYNYGVLAIPINAVTTREEEDSIKKSDFITEYVFVVNKENKTQLKEVKTGIQNNEYIEVLKGLTFGEKVIVAPYAAIARTLKKDTKVKVVPKKSLYENVEEEKD